MRGGGTLAVQLGPSKSPGCEVKNHAAIFVVYIERATLDCFDSLESLELRSCLKHLVSLSRCELPKLKIKAIPKLAL